MIANLSLLASTREICTMNPEFFHWFVIGWIALAVFTFPWLLKFRAPYGRHSREGWGPMVSNKWAWFIMELPALLIMPILAISGPVELSTVSILLVGMWSFHYINRTLIFPFRIKTKGKKMPLSILGSAIFFNAINGFVNGYFIGWIGNENELSMTSPILIFGLLLYLTGFIINNAADTYLISLRSNSTSYQIPRSPLFRRISCPNHFGEIVEWCGFALCASSLPALSFAVWSFANLAPRAYNHHQWYKENFDDYPKERKAVIPWIF